MNNKKLVSWLEHKKNEVNSYKPHNENTRGYIMGQLDLIDELLTLLSKPPRLYQD